jgi:polar amino acid transport system substrate-binding protein
MGRSCLLVIAAALLFGCQFPRDPEGTLDRVRGGVMRVGVTHAEPWVKLKGAEPAGVEVELVERFAETLGARVEWVEGSESDLMEALHGRHLDVVIAGLTRRSEWQRVAALTRPYVTYEVVIAAPDRETAERLSEDLEGERIAVEANSPEAAKLEEDTDAEVVPVDDIAAVDGPAAVPEY